MDPSPAAALGAVSHDPLPWATAIFRRTSQLAPLVRLEAATGIRRPHPLRHACLRACRAAAAAYSAPWLDRTAP